jgi:polysaccharide export outer membrane protein
MRPSRMTRKIFGITRRGGTALVIVLLGGCASGNSGDAKAPPTDKDQQGANLKLNAWLQQQQLDVPTAVYRLASPDKIKIVAPGVKEIDGEQAVVRSDGKVGLNLIGEVNAGGKTPAEVSEAISEKLTKFYKADTIDVSVQVLEFKSQHYYVFGQVIEPGIKAYTGRDTVLRVLADAKLNEKAWPEKVVIVRPNEDVSVHQRVTVDLKEMYENGTNKQNFLIEAGDVVFVPPSPLAQIDDTFRKLITPIIPATQLGEIVRAGGL